MDDRMPRMLYCGIRAERQRNLHPSSDTFTSLIDGYAQQANVAAASGRSSTKAAAAAVQNCQDLLAEMKYLATTGPPVRVSPSSRSYASLLNALANSRLPNAAWTAETYLQEMWNVSMVTPSGSPSYVRPSKIHYNAVLDAWAKSRHPNKLQHVERIWREMERKASPDVNTYNSLLAMVAHTVGRAKVKAAAWQLDMQVLEKLNVGNSREYRCRPTSLSYGSRPFVTWCRCRRRPYRRGRTPV